VFDRLLDKYYKGIGDAKTTELVQATEADR
jgi:uncharacterized protein (DUF1810 family)